MQQIPIAGSIIDHIDTLETANRNSTVRLTRRTYSILTITVKPALSPFVSIVLSLFWRV